MTYIVPPGLKCKVDEFIAHYKASGGAPIMICGPSGVGKSLFLHLFKKLYKEEHGPKVPIVQVNCSHFEGQLARSELFGHVKGAFTDAVETKEGWLKKADGGVLILEEIGDLPSDTQAKLLTFIEDGKFHKLGSTKIESAKVQIVAATNKESSIREDFKYRFFPFYVPPLYQRREDVLYYIAFKFPELIRELMPWEVLTLFAYNWPGNVREVERIGRILKKQKLLRDASSLKFLAEAIEFLEDRWRKFYPAKSMQELALKSGLTFVDSKASELKGYKANQLYLELEKSRVDVKLLEDTLMSFGLGLSIKHTNKVFEDIGNIESYLEYDERLDIYFFKKIPAFTKAYRGFQKFCALFCQTEKVDRNILDMEFDNGTLLPSFDRLLPGEVKLAEEILNWLKNRVKEKDSNGFSLTSFTRDELLKMYYSELLEETHGNQMKASKMAGLKYTTFREQLKKYGVI